MLFEPLPQEIKAARLKAGLTQTGAAELVYVKLRIWQYWEAMDEDKQVKMPLATWELFLIKTGQHKIKVKK